MRALKKKNGLALCLLFVLGSLVLTLPANASISPTLVEATLHPCESIYETKTVHVEEMPAKADVIFSFDVTGSMDSIIATAKMKADEIIDKLDATGVDIQYGVMSYSDYPHHYSSCGYSANYGGSGDHAYLLLTGITNDRDVVKAAINSLTTKYGGDGPEDYTRIMYESYADVSVGWRTGAKKILGNFGDNVPHDCDLNEGVPGKVGTWTTGDDPGRDEVMGTADDLDLQTVLAGMAANGVILLECHTSSSANEYWDYWTGITGGGLYLTGSATLVNDVNAAVTAALTTPIVYGLHIEASSGFESWVSSEPDSYDEVEPCHEVTFEVTIHVPEGTEDGVYIFTVSAMDEDGVSYGDQRVIITVVTAIPVPVDIKPTSCPNPLNLGSGGVIPVAINGTEGFDVTTVDPDTVTLMGVAPLRWSFEDVSTPFEPLQGKEDELDCTEEGPDEIMDLTLKFDKQEVVKAIEEQLGEPTDGQIVVLQLRGKLLDEFSGTQIEGEDVVIIRKKGKK